MTEQIAAVAETPAPDDEMGALFDKLTADGIDEEQPEVEAPESEDAAPEPVAETVPEPVEAPADLPAGIKAKWADMPEEARDAVLSSHRDMSRKMADQGRIVQAAKPIYDVLVQAVQDIPTMANMTPAQIANDVFQMAKIQGELARDPVKTILGIAQQYGAIDGMRAALAGKAPDQSQQNTIAMQQEIRRLQAQVQQFADPALIERRISATMATKDVEGVVASYAASKPFWAEAESAIPAMIPLAKARLGDEASHKDILDAAYDMAIHADPALRAKATTAATAPVVADPARVAAQVRAKSVNVTSRPAGDKPLTDHQVYSRIWDKHAS
jgi:hypothetical protein